VCLGPLVDEAGTPEGWLRLVHTGPLATKTSAVRPKHRALHGPCSRPQKSRHPSRRPRIVSGSPPCGYRTRWAQVSLCRGSRIASRTPLHRERASRKGAVSRTRQGWQHRGQVPMTLCQIRHAHLHNYDCTGERCPMPMVNGYTLVRASSEIVHPEHLLILGVWTEPSSLRRFLSTYVL
jgi:hypothetical protein